MKKIRTIGFALTLLMAFTLSASAFMSFGYVHGVPDNDGEVFIGFDFGDVQTGSFNVQAYLGDLWAVQNGVFLGFRTFYVVDADWADIEAGGYLESNQLSQWPTVKTNKSGVYLDATFHLLPAPCVEPDPCGTVGVDLIVNFELGINPNSTKWDFGGEIGFEVSI